ncbi:MAG: DUF4430 domain-containing protein [Clostridiales Family XIII bacterium]|jgi:hypothetical protein|nr:DUF4430 domain-containing protein [Clostridiales Family XIII bacterium]
MFPDISMPRKILFGLRAGRGSCARLCLCLIFLLVFVAVTAGCSAGSAGQGDSGPQDEPAAKSAIAGALFAVGLAGFDGIEGSGGSDGSGADEPEDSDTVGAIGSAAAGGAGNGETPAGAGGGIQPGTADSASGQPGQSGEPAPSQTASVKTTCTVLVECSTILNNLDRLKPGYEQILPKDAVIMGTKSVEFTEGETVFDVLLRAARDGGIPMSSAGSAAAGTIYIEGIGGFFEFDCGPLSGWRYSVNGSYPGYGCSKYALKNGDRVEWHYTCDLGADLGAAVDQR